MTYYQTGQMNYTSEQVRRINEVIHLINFGHKLSNNINFYLQANTMQEAQTKLALLDNEVQSLKSITTQYLKGKIRGLMVACRERNTEQKLRLYKQEVMQAIQNILMISNVVRGINVFSKGTLAKGQYIDNTNVAFQSGIVEQLRVNLKGVEEPLRRIIVADKLERLLESRKIKRLPNGVTVMEQVGIVPFQEVIETTDYVLQHTGN